MIRNQLRSRERETDIDSFSLLSTLVDLVGAHTIVSGSTFQEWPRHSSIVNGLLNNLYLELTVMDTIQLIIWSTCLIR